MLSDSSFIYAPEVDPAVDVGGRWRMGGQNALERERLALLSLWTIPGVGPKALEAIGEVAGGDWAGLVDQPCHAWLRHVPPSLREAVGRLRRLGELGERTLERARRAKIEIAFRGEEAYPARLAEIDDAPPLLFYKGRIGPPRRRVAMVGSRHPDTGFLEFAQAFAAKVARGGVGVVSGAALGVDRVCHQGALDAGGETWAFVGSALDELDPPQAALLPKVLDGGGIFYTELPPGVRASVTTFPRRNRLISGSSDAVLVLRAAHRSGALLTAENALDQGRPLLALPGDALNDAAFGCNALIRSGNARLCLEPEDIFKAVGFQPVEGDPPPPVGEAVDWSELSGDARAAYRALHGRPQPFEEVLQTTGIPADTLTSALCELELRGLVVQHPGKRYERI